MKLKNIITIPLVVTAIYLFAYDNFSFNAIRKKVINKYKGMSIEELQKAIKTPKESQKFMKYFYGIDGWCPLVANGNSYLIHDDGYSPEPICLVRFKDKYQPLWPYHWICVYKKNNKFGSIDSIFGHKKAKYDNIGDIVRDIAKKEKIEGMTYSRFRDAMNTPINFTVEDFKRGLEELNEFMFEKEKFENVWKGDFKLLWKTGK